MIDDRYRRSNQDHSSTGPRRRIKRNLRNKSDLHLPNWKISEYFGRHRSSGDRETARNGGGQAYCSMRDREKASKRRSAASSKSRRKEPDQWSLGEQKPDLGWRVEPVSVRPRGEGLPTAGREWKYRRIRVDRDANTIVGAKHRGSVVSAVNIGKKFATLVRASGWETAESAQRRPGRCGACDRLGQRQEVRRARVGCGRASSAGFYFAQRCRSWERGPDERRNGLAGENFPKRIKIGSVSDGEILEVEYNLKARLRKALGFHAPAEQLAVVCAPCRRNFPRRSQIEPPSGVWLPAVPTAPGGQSHDGLGRYSGQFRPRSQSPTIWNPSPSSSARTVAEPRKAVI